MPTQDKSLEPRAESKLRWVSRSYKSSFGKSNSRGGVSDVAIIIDEQQRSRENQLIVIVNEKVRRNQEIIIIQDNIRKNHYKKKFSRNVSTSEDSDAVAKAKPL